MKPRLFFLGFCLTLLFNQCAPPLSLSHSNFETLNLRMEIDPAVDRQVAEAFALRLHYFIQDHNRESKYFRLSNHEDQEETTLTIYISENKMVGPNQQLTGVVLSTLGIVLPVVMVSTGAAYYLWFVYIPEDVSQAQIFLSEDINDLKDDFITKRISNSGFLRSYDKQVIKHGEKFELFLSVLVKEVERSYKKQKKQSMLTAY